jgi:thioredoxin-related protein
MPIMKKIAIAMVACWAVWQVQAAEPNWLTDLATAQAKAKAENKMVLLDFTGSDWCPPCKALYKNVLASDEFVEYAKKNLVLVEVDFPISKPQSDELKKANKELSARFEIEGYPTVIILDGSGKQLGKDAGYGGAKPKEFIARIEVLKKK